MKSINAQKKAGMRVNEEIDFPVALALRHNGRNYIHFALASEYDRSLTPKVWTGSLVHLLQYRVWKLFESGRGFGGIKEIRGPLGPALRALARTDIYVIGIPGITHQAVLTRFARYPELYVADCYGQSVVDLARLGRRAP
ncbi:MAG: hypothetical protein WD081_03870 [Gammaproteobacteria bacterium]